MTARTVIGASRRLHTFSYHMFASQARLPNPAINPEALFIVPRRTGGAPEIEQPVVLGFPGAGVV